MIRFSAIFLCCFFTAIGLYAQKPKSNQTAPKKNTPVTMLKNDEEKMSYLSGYDLGLKVSSNIKANNFPLHTSSFLTGIKEALEGKENALSPEEIQKVIEIFQKMNPQAENQKKLESLIAKHKKEGEDFLSTNALRDSIIVTASGLQYKIIQPGTGKAPVESSMVTVHYRGRLLSGVVFDESYARGEPTTFRLNQVIKGWTEGLQLMREGATYEFYIPNHLAYGEQPAGQLIPPGSMLIFEVELLSVK